MLAYNYSGGKAGAIDYFGKHYGLPHAISGHNRYGYWGPRGIAAAKPLVGVSGLQKVRLLRRFSDVRPFETITPPHAIPGRVEPRYIYMSEAQAQPDYKLDRVEVP